MAADVATWRAVAATGATASALLHFGAAVIHAGHGTGFVVFFAMVGAGQLSLAALLRQQPRPGLVLAAMLGTVALIVAYPVQQLGGLPSVAGHHSDAPDVAVLALITLGAQLATVLALPLLVVGRWRTSSFNVALLGGAALWTLWLVG